MFEITYKDGRTRKAKTEETMDNLLRRELASLKRHFRVKKVRDTSSGKERFYSLALEEEQDGTLARVLLHFMTMNRKLSSELKEGIPCTK